MNTTIIIVLILLIVIVGIAIVAVVVKSRKGDKKTEVVSESPMTFQEEAPQEPPLYTPQLHEETVSTDLNTPIQAEVMPEISVVEATQPEVLPTLDQPINQVPMESQQIPVEPISNVATVDENPYSQIPPLPDNAQMSQDMEQLNQANIVQGSTQLREDTAQTSVPTAQQTTSDMETIMDAINTPVQAPEVPQDTTQTPLPPVPPAPPIGF